jgi:signal transduction histidine kinase
MLINIVDNAFKYTPANGSVKIELASDNNSAIISVRDTGSGIPEKHISHVTEPFYKIKSGNRYEGAGLGLAIVKQIADVHNGSLKIESIEGSGTTVTIKLPLYSDSGDAD